MKVVDGPQLPMFTDEKGLHLSLHLRDYVLIDVEFYGAFGAAARKEHHVIIVIEEV